LQNGNKIHEISKHQEIYHKDYDLIVEDLKKLAESQVKSDHSQNIIGKFGDAYDNKIGEELKSATNKLQNQIGNAFDKITSVELSIAELDNLFANDELKKIDHVSNLESKLISLLRSSNSEQECLAITEKEELKELFEDEMRIRENDGTEEKKAK